VDLLHVVQSHVSASADVKELARRLTAQRAELRETNRELGLLYSVTQAVTDAASLAEVAPAVLARVCEATGWECGALWALSDGADALTCETFYAHDRAVGPFEPETRAVRFAPGVGLPGRVLATGQATWIADVQQDPNFPRGPAAAALGLHAAAAFPIATAGTVRAVCEFFTRAARAPDERALRMLAEVGVKLGDFLHRRAAEDALRRAKEAAEAATRAKSRFLASMSHELRTPLNAILGFSQLMDRDRALSPVQRERLGVINRAGEHLLGLINDVLSISRIEAGEVVLHEEPFDLLRTLDAVEALLRPRAEAKGLRLVLDLDPDLPRHVRGDQGKLRQILFNLVGNAVKFTAQGEVRVEAAWREGTARVVVSDTGPGIAAEELRELFRPFAQSEAGRRAKEGTGLGLAISRSFAEAMGGRLDAESAPGRGATFRLEVALPPCDGTTVAETDHALVVGLAPGQAARRILIVDDAPENRRFLVQVLGEVGLETREAQNGREALDLFDAWAPHLVLMDMRMPVMDGFEATRELRARERERGLARTPVIALTASAFDHDRRTILDAGCDGFIAKPFVLARLFRELEERLGIAFAREASAAPAAPAPAAPASRDRARGPLAAAAARLSPELRADLQQALVIGDDIAALAALDRVAARDPAAAELLRARVRAVQFDELLEALEGAP
jgi:two-component system sensor histidine kinase/response regulator